MIVSPESIEGSVTGDGFRVIKGPCYVADIFPKCWMQLLVLAKPAIQANPPMVRILVCRWKDPRTAHYHSLN